MVHADQRSANDREYVTETLSRCIGLECWHVSFVEELCAAIGLSIGEKIPRKRPLRNGTSEFSQFEPEFKLMIWCPWRIRINEEIVLSSEVATNERVNAVLPTLASRKVVECQLKNSCWDIRLTFDGGTVLDTFCVLNSTIDPNKQCDISIKHGGRRLALGPGTRISDKVID
jgi:hypothetical protein